jgi:hypothetical protein
VGIVALLAMTSALWFIGIKPVVDARNSEARAADRREQFEAELAEATAAAEKAATKAEEFERRLAGITHEPRPASELNARISELIDIAAEAGIEIDSLAPGRAAESAFSDDVRIDVSGRTAPSGVEVFLSKLHNKAPDLAVRSITVDARGDAAVSLRIGMVWRAAPATVRTPTTPGG